MSKAIVGDGDQLECGPRWIAARRARLELFDDRLECGNWSIGYDEIRLGVLSSFNSPILRIPGYILALKTDEKTYHFGLNGGRYWQGELPFAVTRKNVRLRLSIVSLIARVMLIVGVAYFVWQRFK